MKFKTLQDFIKKFPTEKECLDHIMAVKYGRQCICPKCNQNRKFHRISRRRAYACPWCGYHLYPCVGTLFEKSRTPLKLWLFAIYLFTTASNGVSGKELQRQLGVTYKCAWRMGHQIRKHMANMDGKDHLLLDIVVGPPGVDLGRFYYKKNGRFYYEKNDFFSGVK